MKKIILFLIIFVSGMASFALFSNYQETKQNKLTDTEVVLLEETPQVIPSPQVELIDDEDEPPVIVENGALLEGPFSLIDARGNTTQATVRIIYSPEETLVQFENWAGAHGSDAYIYFATDEEASDYVNLSPAKMTSGVLVYGVPLDIDLSSYNYLLVFDTFTNETLYSARIQ